MHAHLEHWCPPTHHYHSYYEPSVPDAHKQWTYSGHWGSELAEPRSLWSPHRSSYPCDEHLSWILLPTYPPQPPPQLLLAFNSWYTQTCIYELTLDFEGVNLQNRGVRGVLTGVVSYPCDEHPSWILLPPYPPPPPPLPAFSSWYTQTCIYELTLDVEGVKLQNQGVCGVLTEVVIPTWWTPILNTIARLPTTTTTTTTTSIQCLIHTDLYLWTYSGLWGRGLAEQRGLWSPHRSSYPCDEHPSYWRTGSRHPEPETKRTDSKMTETLHRRLWQISTKAGC